MPEKPIDTNYPDETGSTQETTDGIRTPDGYEQQTLNWIEIAEKEGEALLQAEMNYGEMDKYMAYVMGEQTDPRRPTGLSSAHFNRFKHIISQTVSALTDVHPLFGFKSFNPKFQEQSAILDKLARAWWVNTFSDLKLADTIRYAAVLGTGYVEVHWDANYGGGVGDIRLIPRDPRAVIPIRPRMDGGVQDWEGVIIKSSKSVNEMKARFQKKAHLLTPDRHPSIFTRSWTKAKRLMSAITSPMPVDVISDRAPKDTVSKIPTMDVLQVYMKDRRLHKGKEPIIMGDKRTSWSYKVYPVGYPIVTGEDPQTGEDITRPATEKDARLYPRGRYIIATRKAILHDGPNPYWHGMFPVVKLTLDPWPWSILGQSIGKDLVPLQDTLNELANGILDKARQALRPPLIGDKKAISQGMWERIDTRMAGLKIKTNPAAGKAVEIPNMPDLPSFVSELLEFTVNEMDTLSGVGNLSMIMQLNQMPSAESVDKIHEALTPVLRLKGRQMESFLREMGEMVKGNFFQFYNMPRRVSMLGEQGVAFDDFDFDLGTLIPAMSPGDDSYHEFLDARLDRATRAQQHQKNFTFQITPNSLLAVSQISRKMLYLQLWRGGLMDPWTLWEILEIPNGGTPPGEVNTIMERLIAAMGLGITGSVSPAGRKASGQESPQGQQKGQGVDARPVVSETGSGGG